MRRLTLEELRLGRTQFKAALSKAVEDGELHAGEELWHQAWERFREKHGSMAGMTPVLRQGHHTGWWAHSEAVSSHVLDTAQLQEQEE